jgi:hypothetical protein
MPAGACALVGELQAQVMHVGSGIPDTLVQVG